MILLFFCFIILANPIKSAKIFKLRTSGRCTNGVAGQQITNKETCQLQAQLLGLSDLTATSVAMSGTLPGGCIFINSKQQLKIYESTNTIECSDEYQCICEYTANSCTVGINTNDCICGDNVCQSENGLRCTDGICTHADVCQNGTNDVCKCGLVDCTPLSGLVCSENICKHAPDCTNKHGLIANIDMCKCGSMDCASEYCVAVSNTCRRSCPGGKFITNQHICEPWDIAGYYCPPGATQSKTFFPCPRGTYSPTIGISLESECLKCTSGRYSDNTGGSSIEDCRVCSANMYQDLEGQTNCKGCPNEMVIHDTMDALKHNSLDDCQTNIPTCLAAEYLQNNSCTLCENGFDCDGLGKIICPSGHYCQEGIAIECPSGRYGESTGQKHAQTACIDCSPGTFQTVSGETYCARSCPLGTYGNVSGGVSEIEACVQCPTGHMCGTMAMQQPVRCPMGTFQDNKLAHSCKPCPIGTYGDTIAAVECKICGKDENGVFKKTTGIGSNNIAQCVLVELSCPNAQRPTEDAVCEQCSPGFYANGLGTRCMLCPPGTKQPMMGAFSCELCTACNMIGHANTKYIPFNENNTIQLIKESEVSTTYDILNIIIYASVVGVICVIIVSHRLCPVCLKELDLFFSGDHTIEDTHALRILNTRLGAALTLSIPFIIVAVVVFVFTDDNTTFQSSLVPEGTVEIQDGFGNVYFQYKAWFANGISNCDKIQVRNNSYCTFSTKTLENACLTNITCSIGQNFAGKYNIDIKMPDNQQWATLTAYPDMWMREIVKTTQKIVPTTILAGTSTKPTTLSFSLTKCKYMSKVDNINKYGIKMNRRNYKKQESTIGTLLGMHVVRIELIPAENIYLYRVDVKLSLLTQLSTVLTFFISILSSLHTVKTCLEKTIDGCYVKCCANVPKDIKRRINILEERTSEDIPNSTRHIEPPRHRRHTRPDEEGIEIIRDHENPITPKQDNIHVDDATGQKYSYNHVTKTSKWIL